MHDAIFAAPLQVFQLLSRSQRFFFVCESLGVTAEPLENSTRVFGTRDSQVEAVGGKFCAVFFCADGHKEGREFGKGHPYLLVRIYTF